MKCKICGDEFYYSDGLGPEEPCFCGAMCKGSIYQWVGLRGYFMLLLCRIALAFQWVTDTMYATVKYFSWKE